MDSADKFEVEKLISLAPGFSQVVTMSLTGKPLKRLLSVDDRLITALKCGANEILSLLATHLWPPTYESARS